MTSESIDETAPGPDGAAAVRPAGPPTGGPRATFRVHVRCTPARSRANRLARERVDWSLVAALRAQASEQLSQAVAADRARLDKAAQEELGRSIVLDLIEATVADRVNAGTGRMVAAPSRTHSPGRVFDSLFRLGRLQPLVDNDEVENIIITGHDNVLLELIDGSLVERARRGGLRRGADRLPRLPRLPLRGERPRLLRGSAPAPPAPRRRLPSRGCGVGDTSAVRRHPTSPADGGHPRRPRRAADAHARSRHRSCGLRCGRARASSSPGSQGAGKTTLVRALCAEIDPLEAIGTFETEYELHLHELQRHKIVHPWEARPGSGERGPDGRHGRRVHARRRARRLLPLQPLPPDRRRGPRQGDLGDDQGDGVRHRAPSPRPTPRTPSRRSASW